MKAAESSAGKWFRLVKTARGCDVPDTPEQREFVRQFAEELHAR